MTHPSRADAILAVVFAATFVFPLACTKSPPPSPPVLAEAASEPSPAPAPETEPDPFALTANRPVTLEALPWPSHFAAMAEAEAAIERERYDAALMRIERVQSAAASLVRARAHLGAGRTTEARAALDTAAGDAVLGQLVALVRGQIAAASKDWAEAAKVLGPLLDAPPEVATRAALPLMEALAASDPQALVDRSAAIEAVLPTDEPDGRSRLLAAKADALASLKKGDLAREIRVQRYLEEPVSPLTPAKPPEGVSLTPQQRLARVEALLEAHRNDRVLDELAGVPEEGLAPEEVCRRRFASGLAHRKLHNYGSAENDLGYVVDSCADEDLARRAMYLMTKVISIKSGLRAIKPIEGFAKRFAGHSMVDDVLFWAGDLYQRRSRWAEADRYYARIENLPERGDHCADARWRRAWMAYRAGELGRAVELLERAFLDDGCSPEAFERARARYWVGQIAWQQKKNERAIEQWTKVLDLAPLGIYGQLALARILELDPASKKTWTDELRAPQGDRVPPLCPGWLADDADFKRGLALLSRGLGVDARAAFLGIDVAEQKVVATEHAVSQGIAPAAVKGAEVTLGKGCTEDDPGLLLALLLDKAGAHRDAHWRLRTEFADALDAFPTPETVGLFRAAYPLAYRAELEAAEKESGVPELFLQALAREESAFDADIVSWAGAYGLTQLLMSTAKGAGRLLEPPVKIMTEEQLMDPALNARLGGALMGSLLRRYDGFPPLALVAYNASQKYGDTLKKRHAGQGFDLFAEEISIRETRGYVKRVTRTYGIYRWLYAGEPPALPVSLVLPAAM